MQPVIDQSIAGNFGAPSGPSSSVPGMLGDSYITTTGVAYNLGGVGEFRALVPYGGRYKCADNTGPVPTNRVSFVYKHFHNALQSETLLNGARVATTNGQIDSYILGVEKAFLDNWASLEIRVPFYGGSVINNTLPNNSFISSPAFGNLSFILKALWSRSDTFALGGGLGIDVPTAGNSTGLADGVAISYNQKSAYLAPFVAFLGTPSDNWWYQGVVQFSFATGRNEMFIPAAAIGPGVDINAQFQEQHLVFITFNAGKWITRTYDGRGVAAIAEMNYTATLNETHVSLVTDGVGNSATLTNFANNQNVLALTTGVHFQITPVSNLRIATVVPLKGGNAGDPLARDRYFDAELSVQFNRYW